MSESLEKPKDVAKATKPKPKVKWLAWLKILILPLTLAGGGLWAQIVVNRSSLQKEYVSLSVGILASKDVHQGLRKWAADLLDQTSPIPLPSDAKSDLAKGIAMLPAKSTSTVLDQPSAQMAFAAPPKESDDSLKYKVSVLNSALKSINEKEPRTRVDELLLTELAGQRDKILRQRFESSFRIFVQYSSDPNSINQEQRSEIAPIIEWSQLELHPPK